MNMKTFKKIGTSLICALFAMPLMAQQTYEEMEQLTVNEQVTTVITASEPIRFVDISTDMVVGDQPINNTIRLKPKEGAHADGEVLAIVTIVTERYRTQYALLYTTRLQEAVTDKQIQPEERIAYNNPSVSMSTEDMAKYARSIWNSTARIRNVSTKQHRMMIRLTISIPLENISSWTFLWRTRRTFALTLMKCASNWQTKSSRRLLTRRLSSLLQPLSSTKARRSSMVIVTSLS